jgi:hypothetical protein
MRGGASSSTSTEEDDEGRMVTLSFAKLRRLIEARARAEDHATLLLDRIGALELIIARQEARSLALSKCCEAVIRKNQHAAATLRADAARMRDHIERQTLSRRDSMLCRALTYEEAAKRLSPDHDAFR